MLSLGGLIVRDNGIGWGSVLRIGELNKDGRSEQQCIGKYFIRLFFVEIFNARQYPVYDLAVHTSIGWESLQPHGREKMMVSVVFYH